MKDLRDLKHLTIQKRSARRIWRLMPRREFEPVQVISHKAFSGHLTRSPFGSSHTTRRGGIGGARARRAMTTGYEPLTDLSPRLQVRLFRPWRLRAHRLVTSRSLRAQGLVTWACYWRCPRRMTARKLSNPSTRRTLARTAPTTRCVQEYLAYNKHPFPRTLQQDYYT